MNHVFAFCGPIGSGKSSVSKIFAVEIGANWNSFGSTARAIAVERMIPTDRNNLQKLGALLVDKESDFFCRHVLHLALKFPNEPAVVDGLRHKNVLREIEHLVIPRKTFLVYVDTPFSLRCERVKLRDQLSPQQLKHFDRHSTEIEVEEHLRSRAHFVVDNSTSKELSATSLVNWAKTLV